MVMFSRRSPIVSLAIAAAVASAGAARADDLADQGVTLLHAAVPTLSGSGVVVAQPEADISFNSFEVSPDAGAHSVFYMNGSGDAAASYTNDVGTFSSHATTVASIGFGSGGVAPGVPALYNYDAYFFANHIITPDPLYQPPPDLRVINQSFVLNDYSLDYYNTINQLYDNFINQYNVVVASGAGNGVNAGMPQVQMPATNYNGISVGAFYIAQGSTGTPDGRSKIDITGLSNATSFSTPVVSGTAALLEQAAAQGVAGPGTQASAADSRTIKSVLLTGATKTPGWTNSPASPLDPQVGAGIVNAYASYQILQAGQFHPSSVSSIPLGSTNHPAVTAGTPVGRMGWALQSDTVNQGAVQSGIFSTPTADAINHFVLNLPATGARYTLTATLTWNRPTDNNLSDKNWSGFNNLDLFLYGGNTQITASTSTVDNVEHLYLPSLAPGTYDLQVLKHGGIPSLTSTNAVSFGEDYSLSWSAQLLGDTNWDGVVDATDLATVTSHLGTNARSPFLGDLNNDGIVDAKDLAIVTSNMSSSIAAATIAPITDTPILAAPITSLASVPEPASLTLILLAAPLLLRRRPRAL